MSIAVIDIIAVPGWWCKSEETFGKFQSYWSDVPNHNFRVFELRYHDANNDHPDLSHTGIKEHVFDLKKRILDSQRQCVLMGYSGGGPIVLKTAANVNVNESGLVKAVVLLAPAQFAGLKVQKTWGAFKTYWKLLPLIYLGIGPKIVWLSYKDNLQGPLLGLTEAEKKFVFDNILVGESA